MSVRALSSGTVSFGLVSIPVKLYTASQSSANVSFNLLHKKCSSRVKQQYICPTDGETVPREDMVKGYEFSKGQYVTFTDDELKALEEQATQAIEISEFVPADKVDPIYFDKAYYLGPEKGGEKAYRLLAEAMKRTKRCALARYAARGKQYLVLLRPLDGKLVMQQLHYADEVRSISEVPIADGEVREQEMKLAVQLVEQIATDTFRPEEYEDDVKKRVLEQIDRKVAGQEVSLAPAATPKAQIIDLMEALKASLAAKGAGSTEERKPAKAAATAPAKSSRAKSRKE